MNNESFFRLSTFLLLAGIFTISIVYRHRAERQGGRMASNEGQRAVFIVRLLALGAILPLAGYLLNPDWVTWARLTPPGWLRWLGLLAAAACIPLAYWVFHSLGLNVSPTQATRVGHQLVTDGPYHWVRHPLYTVGFLFWIAIILITGLWWLALWLLPGGTFIVWRTPEEEARLVAAFGDEYRAYMTRTGRFLPRLL